MGPRQRRFSRMDQAPELFPIGALQSYDGCFGVRFPDNPEQHLLSPRAESLVIFRQTDEATILRFIVFFDNPREMENPDCCFCKVGFHEFPNPFRELGFVTNVFFSNNIIMNNQEGLERDTAS